MSTFAESQHPRGTGGRFSPKTKAGAGVGLQTDGRSPYQVHADRLVGVVQGLFPGHEVSVSLESEHLCGAPEGAQFVRVGCYDSLHQATGDQGDADVSIGGYLLPDGDMSQVSLMQQWVSNDPQVGVEAESLYAGDVDSTGELASHLPDLAQRLARRAGMRKAIRDRVPYGDTDLIPSMVSDTQVRMEWGGRYRHRETVVFDLSDPEGMFAPEIRTAYGDVRVDGADRELVVSGFGRELLMAQDRFDLLGHEDSARVAYDHVADLFAHAWAADPFGAL